MTSRGSTSAAVMERERDGEREMGRRSDYGKDEGNGRSGIQARNKGVKG